MILLVFGTNCIGGMRMSKLRGILLLVSVLSLNLSQAQEQPTVLIAYYSVSGHTKTMAESIASGARAVKNVTVKVMTVGEVKKEDLLNADAIIVGSPVHNANAAPEVVRFIAGWPFQGAPLFNKIGAAFVTSGGISAGEELTQMNILHSMLLYGMVVVGGEDWTSAFGASAITAEQPFGEAQKGAVVADQFLKKAAGLGKRVAELAVRLKRGHYAVLPGQFFPDGIEIPPSPIPKKDKPNYWKLFARSWATTHHARCARR
jgi:NAD(P)H dehydrogenase (quinone)